MLPKREEQGKLPQQSLIANHWRLKAKQRNRWNFKSNTAIRIEEIKKVKEIKEAFNIENKASLEARKLISFELGEALTYTDDQEEFDNNKNKQ